jgi:hypothetical protein
MPPKGKKAAQAPAISPEQKEAAAVAKAAGNTAFSAGNFEEAVKQFSAAIASDPTDHIYFSNRRCGPQPARRQALHSAVTDCTRHVMLRSACYASLGLYPKAIEVRKPSAASRKAEISLLCAARESSSCAGRFMATDGATQCRLAPLRAAGTRRSPRPRFGGCRPPSDLRPLLTLPPVRPGRGEMRLDVTQVVEGLLALGSGEVQGW